MRLIEQVYTPTEDLEVDGRQSRTFMDRRRSSVFSVADLNIEYPESTIISGKIFCDLFPFHVVFDKDLVIKQCGIKLQKMAGRNLKFYIRHAYNLRIYPHRESAAAAAAVANAGEWWRLGMGPIFKHDHWPALAAAATDAWRVCSFATGTFSINNTPKRIILLKTESVTQNESLILVDLTSYLEYYYWLNGVVVLTEKKWWSFNVDILVHNHGHTQVLGAFTFA